MKNKSAITIINEMALKLDPCGIPKKVYVENY